MAKGHFGPKWLLANKLPPVKVTERSTYGPKKDNFSPVLVGSPHLPSESESTCEVSFEGFVATWFTGFRGPNRARIGMHFCSVRME